ncbi:MAG: hypothetical protein IJ197_07700 [Bacteroidaceae bacterium]|nr:hypothetical protein [Bacteroidaceae bacterium]
MAVNYSFVVRLAKVSEKEQGRRIYAAAQSTGTVTTRDIARHLTRHHSPFSEGTIIGLLQDAQRCIMEHLLAGARVNLDDLGAFYTTIASRGAKSVEEFDESFIKSINLRWKPSREMSKAVGRVKLHKVATRAEQRRAKHKMQEIANQEVAASKRAKRTEEAEQS